ncbi:pyridoxal-phosphate dependent enzyme, partial [Streptococcus pyogenes]
GTGGTISGAGTFLKEKNPDVKVVAVEPAWASISSKDNPDVKEIMGTHRFSDLTGNAVPDNVERNIIDEVIEVQTEDAYEAA